MSNEYPRIEIKLDKSTLPQDGQKVKYYTGEYWKEGIYDDKEQMFSVDSKDFHFAWDVHEWQPVDDTPRRDHLPISREEAGHSVLENTLQQILDATDPCNQRECISWILTAREEANGALAIYRASKLTT